MNEEIHQKALWRFFNEDLFEFEALHEDIWFKAYKFDKVVNDKIYVLLKPINMNDFGAEKWSKNSLSIELKQVKGALSLAKLLRQYENGYLYFNMDLSK